MENDGAARSVALLRGVNVGGVNLKMVDVADCLSAAGFEGVRTVLASGNVLIDSSSAPSTDKRRIETALRKRFDYEAWVHVLRLTELEAIVDAYPFETNRDGWHDYVIVCAKPEFATEIGTLSDGAGAGDEAGVGDGAGAGVGGDAGADADRTDAVERVAPGEGVVYWTVPKGDTLSSAVGRLTSKARFREWTTTRNLRTLRKLLG